MNEMGSGILIYWSMLKGIICMEVYFQVPCFNLRLVLKRIVNFVWAIKKNTLLCAYVTFCFNKCRALLYIFMYVRTYLTMLIY